MKDSSLQAALYASFFPSLNFRIQQFDHQSLLPICHRSMIGMPKIRGMTPLWMLSAFIAGVSFAFGHHCFYHSLAGTEAPTGGYTVIGADVSKQQLNTAVGTALGFLVKSSLVLAISISFVQAFWGAMRTSQDGPKLSTLDNAFNLPSNYLGIFDRSIWIEFRLPLLLAFIAWSVIAFPLLAGGFANVF